jgi:hypothetical protein
MIKRNVLKSALSMTRYCAVNRSKNQSLPGTYEFWRRTPYVIDALDEGLDKFLNAYLKANQTEESPHSPLILA